MSASKFRETVNDPVEITNQCICPYKSILSDDGALRYDFILSLQKIAMSKIVTSMWMNGNILYCFEKYDYFMDFIENEISTLGLPSTFTGTLKKTFIDVRNSVRDWITYHDEYIFNIDKYIFNFDEYTVNTRSYHETSAIKYANNIKWNSQGRIDSGQTAKDILANRENSLSDEHKYRLACTYCLEDEIASIAPNVVNGGYLDGLKKSENPMVYFWTAHITGDIRKFPITSFFSKIEYFGRLNEVSIIYVWNRLSADEKSECISSTALLRAQNISTYISLLSACNYEQQQVVFRGCSYPILKKMFDDWLWEDYFLPTALHVFYIMRPDDYLRILIDLLAEINGEKDERLCNQYKSVFELLCRESSIHFKDLDNVWKVLQYQLICKSKPMHVDLIEYLLKDFSAEQKKNLIFGNIFFLGRMLWEGKIDHFIKYCEASPEEINYFKNKLVHWINLETFRCGGINIHVMALIIRWWSPSKETVAKVKEYFKNKSKPEHFFEYFFRLLDGILDSNLPKINWG